MIPRLCAAAFAFWSVAARAEPFVPSSDSIVLERLPEGLDPAIRALRTQHAALAADPKNLDLAVKVAAGDIDRARALGDPRYLGRAEAALSPWPASPDAPPRVMLLRAVILQSNHDFGASLAALAQILAQQPGNAQAWLTRASVRLAQADYTGALSDCGHFAGVTFGLAPDTCTASVMADTGRAKLALRALTLSLSSNALEAARAPGIAVWSMTLAAQIAARLDDGSAESRFSQALSIDSSDPYLLGAWADWLLDHDRPDEVRTLLADKTRIDPLLLRLAIAEQALGDARAAGHIADLAARFEASRLRGDTVHRREEARFELALRHRATAALALARANWTVQREPDDARVLMECALAAGRPQEAWPALAWLRDNHFQDTRLSALAARLDAAASARS